MKQEIFAENTLDAAGNPTGGKAEGVGILIHWQDGELARDTSGNAQPNGAFIEGVIEAARQRLMFFQTAAGGRFECAENEAAMAYLGLALMALERRTVEREARGVAGTHKP